MPRSRGSLTVIFLTVFMDLVGFGIVIPLLVHIADTMGAGTMEKGLLFASYSGMQFLFAPFWGWLSDRHGRRPIILLSLTGSTLSYALFAWACLGSSLALLFASRILAGVMGANIAVAQAYIADVTPPEKRAGGMGLIGAAFGLGFICGPALAAGLLHFGDAGPGLGAMVICGGTLVLAALNLPESLAPENRRTDLGAPSRVELLVEAFRTPGLSGLLWMFFAFTVALSIWETTLQEFCLRRHAWGEEAVAWVFTYAGVVSAFVQGYLVRKVRDRLDERRLLRWGLIAAAVAYLALMGATPGWFDLLALGCLAFGVGFTSPSLMALISQTAKAQEQGRVLGVSQSLASLARTVGPMVGYGLIRESEPFLDAESSWIDEGLPFLGAALIVLALLAFLRVRQPVPSAD